MASLEIADEFPELDELAALPRRITGCEADLQPTDRVVKLAPGFDLEAVDCGEPAFSEWPSGTPHPRSGPASAPSTVLLEDTGQAPCVVGYLHDQPTQVVREDLPPIPRRRRTPNGSWI